MDPRTIKHRRAFLAVTALGASWLACHSEAEPKPATPAPSNAAPGAPAPTAAALTAVAPEVASTRINPRLLRRFSPLDNADAVADPAQLEKVALGRMLFFEPRLSLKDDLTCNSCHRLDAYGVDNQPTSIGAGGKRGTRNSPTVYHAAVSFVQFWDGRSPDVEAQAKGPILNPAEMAMPSADMVVARLRQMPGYVEAFARAYPGQSQPVTYDHVGNAIGAFERGLVTPSRWDDYLRGTESALNPSELEGLKVFTDVGCMVCHTGSLLGGNSYQRAGAVKAWGNQNDQGRFQVTHNPGDKMVFKVPTLRNVAETAPYFHDGSIATLPEAVQVMAQHQLGIELEQQEVTAIVAWLRSLTGKLPQGYIARPQLPVRAAGKDHT
ncbi:MAG: cytochrome c peroxidase [Deltaproteobacteria bacterium]